MWVWMLTHWDEQLFFCRILPCLNLFLLFLFPSGWPVLRAGAAFYSEFHTFLVQDCIAVRTSLEGKLARLMVQNHELEDELASWRLHGEPDPSLLATLGASDVLLSLLLAGGVAWRHYYGPDGPAYPVDR
jgi:hypothetical protein